MKTFLMVITVVMLSTITYAQTKGDKILGDWLMNDGTRKINIYKQGVNYFGKIAWVAKPEMKDEMGKIVMRDMSYLDGTYDEGEFIMPNEKHSASCYAELQSDGSLKMTIYHGLKLFGHNIFLTKSK